jgi:CheY-like chemotaxis protein
MNLSSLENSFFKYPPSLPLENKSSTSTALPIIDPIQAQTVKEVTDRLFTGAALKLSSEPPPEESSPMSNYQLQKRGNHILGTTLSMIEATLLIDTPSQFRNEIKEIKKQLLIWEHEFLHNLPILASEHDSTSRGSSKGLTSLPLLQSEITQNPLIKKGNSIIEMILSGLTLSIESKNFIDAKNNLENTRRLLTDLREKFTKNIPLSSSIKELPPLRTRPVAPLKSSKRQYSILLAEDTPSVAKLTMRLLSSLGHNVYLFEDGEKTLTELLNPQRPYHIALLDIQMPFLNGDDVVMQFKQRAEEARESGLSTALKKFNIPCIAYTCNPEDREQYLEKGMVHVLEKPAKAEILDSTITKYAIDDFEVRENHAAKIPCMS